ncbi:MAG TPA: phosphonate C-P lyase system protein PhnH [Dongiaceae bacterium]|nr:phosphonate C-P lyase system protein PhnH [Dongiaceae bacterium]
MFDMTAVSQPGLGDPVHQSQEIFRAVLTALSEPGRIMQVAGGPPASATTALGVSEAALAVLLSLADGDTPLWLGQQSPRLAAYLRFHTGAPIVADPAAAQFALIAAEPDHRLFDRFDTGSEDYPDRSATLIIEVAALAESGPIVLRGPGIPQHRHITIAGLPAAFPRQWTANRALFPCGVDVILTCGTGLMGLPRTVSFEPNSAESSCM